MTGVNIIRNGRLASPADAMFSLDDVDATYGYGCYETLKIRDGVLYFPEFHEERLLRSASILGIATDIRKGQVVEALGMLSRGNEAGDCNIKIMLMGHENRPADCFAFMIPPLVAPAAAYAEGASCLLYGGERHFPQAKSLSMLLSTIAYREAARLGCWDALLVNGLGQITEGTRTNVFYARRGEPDVVYTPPAADVLEGITRRTLILALAESGIRTVERPLTVEAALGGGYGLAVTSTSSRVMPVGTLISHSKTASDDNPERATLDASAEIDRARTIYDDYLARWAELNGREH